MGEGNGSPLYWRAAFDSDSIPDMDAARRRTAFSCISLCYNKLHIYTTLEYMHGLCCSVLSRQKSRLHNVKRRSESKECLVLVPRSWASQLMVSRKTEETAYT